MRYDYIITGGGCAGLSLAVRLMQSAALRSKSILIIDREKKTTNDRTWCFWEEKPDLFEPVVYRSWKSLHFYGEGFSKKLDIAPYRYKMIRGLDFYRHCYTLLQQQANVQFLYADVEHIANQPGAVAVQAGGKTHEAGYVFTSIVQTEPRIPANHHYLRQHFKGWVIETPRPFFKPDEATLMDFRVSQQHGTTFVYVLPVSETRALVEYTLFTKDLLPPEAYNRALQDYIAAFLKITDYRIEEEEFGIIPMTDYPFARPDGRIIPIGTAGGQTKASSGYTFRNIQKHAARLVHRLEQTGTPALTHSFSSRRFKWYDATLLNILAKGELGGHRIFTRLFQRGNPQTMLKFLDNETTLLEDTRVMRRLPTAPFAKAAMQELFK